MNETKIDPEKTERLRRLADALQAEIRGQRHIIPRVVSVLQRGELGLSKTGRPRGSFLFLGPTGVGKTELTQVFTGNLFGLEKLIRYDMSEFQTQESLGLLLGSRPGEKGFLGAAYDRTQTGTLLFDEVEKAHPRIMDVFLQMLDAGIEAMIVSCNTTLGEPFLGKTITHDLIPELEAKGVDVCGENGEFHTVVINCPLFKHRIELPSFTTALHREYWFIQWGL